MEQKIDIMSEKLDEYLKEIRNNIKNKILNNSIFLKIRYDELVKKEIIECTKYLDDIYSNIEIGQRIWHLVNEINFPIYCKCSAPKKFHRFSNGYFKTCGNKECKADKKVNKFKETIEEKYNGNYFGKGSVVRENYEKTMLERHGVKHNFSGHMRDKNTESMLSIYGVKHALQNKDILDKRNNTCIKNHGSTDFFNSESAIKTKIERYGVSNPMQVESIKNQVVHSMKKTKNDLLSNKLSIYDIELIEYTKTLCFLKCNKCHNIFDNHPVTINRKLVNNIDPCNNCNPHPLTHSLIEKDLANYIKEIYSGTVIENKKIVHEGKTYEIDIYLPELNIGFEFNGLYWHSEIYKDKNYHIFKTNICKYNGIDLYHIWEDDWDLKKYIIKSRILSILGKSNRIYGRKCIIKEISNNEYSNFCVLNHIQGNGQSSIRIGLFHNNILVSIMGFSKSRPMFTKKISDENIYELIRYCTISMHTVIGGAEKMFKYFKEKYRPINITTYSDISFSPDPDKSIYKRLGFIYLSDTTPGYSWVIKNSRLHRLNFTKSKLISEGNDPLLTEVEIMHNKGAYRIWDCGNHKFSLK